jgi:hypothetical protein
MAEHRVMSEALLGLLHHRSRRCFRIAHRIVKEQPQIPNPKFQIPNQSQIPESQTARLRRRCLGRASDSCWALRCRKPPTPHHRHPEITSLIIPPDTHRLRFGTLAGEGGLRSTEVRRDNSRRVPALLMRPSVNRGRLWERIHGGKSRGTTDRCVRHANHPWSLGVSAVMSRPGERPLRPAGG